VIFRFYEYALAAVGGVICTTGLSRSLSFLDSLVFLFKDQNHVSSK